MHNPVDGRGVGSAYGDGMEARDLTESQVPVLIVGAGPAGLTTALVLGQQGVRSLVVERRAGVSPLPRATGINVRTMEIFRSLGIAEEVVSNSPDSRGLAHMLEMEWLGGPVIQSIPYRSAIDPTDPRSPSPVGYGFCSQDVLEPILVSAVRRSGQAAVQHSTEVIAFEQHASGVRVRLQNRSTGGVRHLTCDYLVGADGAGSMVRQTLGIAMRGHDHLTHDLNIVFEADLQRAVQGRNALLHRVHHPGLGAGVFRNLDGKGRRWSVFTTWFENPTPERCAEVVRTYVRAPELPVQVTAVGEWERATLLADRFRSGRVFLVGDAAHRVTPHGGLGMNTAVQSAHNLAWKLAAVLRGWAGEGLLDTYEIERREAGARTVDLSYRLYFEDVVEHGRRRGSAHQSSDVLGHVLGTAYRAGALVPDGTAAPLSSVSQYQPVARPGHRAPHHWLQHGGKRVSTLDIFGRGFVLLSPSELWVEAAGRVASKESAPLEAHLIRDPAWSDLYQVGRGGAVLVRPDGYVAWRTTLAGREPAALLVQVLADVLCVVDREGHLIGSRGMD